MRAPPRRTLAAGVPVGAGGRGAAAVAAAVPALASVVGAVGGGVAGTACVGPAVTALAALVAAVAVSVAAAAVPCASRDAGGGERIPDRCVGRIGVAVKAAVPLHRRVARLELACGLGVHLGMTRWLKSCTSLPEQARSYQQVTYGQQISYLMYLPLSAAQCSVFALAYALLGMWATGLDLGTLLSEGGTSSSQQLFFRFR